MMNPLSLLQAQHLDGGWSGRGLSRTNGKELQTDAARVEPVRETFKTLKIWDGPHNFNQ